MIKIQRRAHFRIFKKNNRFCRLLFSAANKYKIELDSDLSKENRFADFNILQQSNSKLIWSWILPKKWVCQLQYSAAIGSKLGTWWILSVFLPNPAKCKKTQKQHKTLTYNNTKRLTKLLSKVKNMFFGLWICIVLWACLI
jgi:hypothetical protein